MASLLPTSPRATLVPGQNCAEISKTQMDPKKASLKSFTTTTNSTPGPENRPLVKPNHLSKMSIQTGNVAQLEEGQCVTLPNSQSQLGLRYHQPQVATTKPIMTLADGHEKNLG